MRTVCMDNFALIVIPIAILIALTCIVIAATREYNAAQERKRKQLLERIPCLCSHRKWMHGGTHKDPGGDRCFERDSLDRGITTFNRCSCLRYRMDNLMFLEQVQKEDENVCI